MGLFGFTCDVVGCVLYVCEVGDVEVNKVPCVFVESGGYFFKVEEGGSGEVFGGGADDEGVC